jgi:hypothetical protein
MSTFSMFDRHHPTHLLYVWRDGRSFRIAGGERVDLLAGSAQAKILSTIVAAHRTQPNRGLSVEQLFKAGWENDIAPPDLAAGRVYSAVSRLRRMGLGEVVRRTASGYGIDSRCCIVEEGASSTRQHLVARTSTASSASPHRMYLASSHRS